MASGDLSKCNKKLLLTKEVVQIAVENDFGGDALLKSFTIKDFAGTNQNFVSSVTSILCDVEIKKKFIKTSYVVKCNPSPGVALVQNFIERFFSREEELLTNICLTLSKILVDIQQPALRVPECVYASCHEKDRQIMLTKDLRLKQFRMVDQLAPMSFNHVTLVLKEYARLHASSYIHKRQLEERGLTLIKAYPNLTDQLLSVINSDFHEFLRLDITVKFLEKEGLVRAASWLKKIRHSVEDVYRSMIRNPAKQFEAICHSDGWSNNFLFRFDDNGTPVEVTIIDLQLCKISTLVSDIHLFLATTTSHELRKSNLDRLLHIYYEMYRTVIQGWGEYPMPFTLEELKKEYIDKLYLGALLVMHYIPAAVRPSEYPYSVEEHYLNPEKTGGFLEKELVINTKMMENAEYKSRFLALFYDLENYNLV